MALQMVSMNSDFNGISGVYIGQRNDAPLFLGEKKFSKFIQLPGDAAIGIGFDTRISPTQVRIFYDKGNAIIIDTDPVNYYGLVVMREIRFDDLPIQPSIYSSAIAHQDRYSEFKPSSVIHFGEMPSISPSYTVDMMSPGLLHHKELGDPFFAYNAIVYTEGMSLDDIEKLSAPNGFLAKLPYGVAEGTPLCASLVAPIGLDLQEPLLEVVTEFLKHFKDQKVEPIITYPPFSNAELLSGAWLQKILTALGITTNDILQLQMVGPYPVLTLTDIEGYFPTLLIDQDSSGIYNLDINEINASQRRETGSLFDRFINFYNENGRYSSEFPKRSGEFTRGYGFSKSVETMQSGGKHKITCTYKVYAVGKGTVESNKVLYNCFGGITWEVSRTFDKAALVFNELSISDPESLKWQDVINYNLELHAVIQGNKTGESLPALSNYLKGLASGDKGNINQFQWFMPAIQLSTDIVGF